MDDVWVLNMIFELLEDPKDISHVSQVCKFWRKVLFESAAVDTLVFKSNWVECLSSSLVKWLANFLSLKRLSISGLVFKYNDCGCSFISQILNCCPNLTHLAISSSSERSRATRGYFHSTASLKSSEHQPIKLNPGAGSNLVQLECFSCSICAQLLVELIKSCQKLRNLFVPESLFSIFNEPPYTNNEKLLNEVPSNSWKSLEIVEATTSRKSTHPKIIEFLLRVAPNIKILFATTHFVAIPPVVSSNILCDSNFGAYQSDFIRKYFNSSRCFRFTRFYFPSTFLTHDFFAMLSILGVPYDPSSLIEFPNDPFSSRLPCLDPDWDFPLVPKLIDENQRGKLVSVLESGYSPDARNKNGETALMFALKHHQYSLIHYLLEHGADTNFKLNSESILQLAIASERQDTLELILKHGADPNQMFEDLHSPLFEDFHENVLVLLLQHGAKFNVKDSKTGETPLHKAISKGFFLLSEKLILNGASVKEKDQKGRTAFVVFCKNVHSGMNSQLALKIVDLMLKAGSSIAEQEPRTKKDCISLCFWSSKTEVVTEKKAIFVDHGVRFEGAARLIRHVNQEVTKQRTFNSIVVKYLFNQVAKEKQYEELCKLGKGAMHHICIDSDDAELALVMLNADPTLLEELDKENSTPLFSAIRYNHNSIASALLGKNANALCKNNQNQNLLEVAINSENEEAAILLINKEHSIVKLICSNGLPPLFIACEKGNEKIVSKILESGADVSITDDNGKTCIFYCSIVPILKSLVSFHSDVAHHDTRGRTILHYASEIGNREIVKFCVEKGLSGSEVDSKGNSPINLAKTRAIQSILQPPSPKETTIAKQKRKQREEKSTTPRVEQKRQKKH